MKEGSGSVQVRPYMYAHHQKDEIERLVAECFKQGLYSLAVVLTLVQLFW